MKFLSLLICISASAILVGCAVFQPAPVIKITKLPIIKVGEQLPENSEFVVFYPAGYRFPVKIKGTGSLFEQDTYFESTAALSRDLYLYKYWSSYDGKIWENSHELMDVNFSGGFDVTGIHIDVSLIGK